MMPIWYDMLNATAPEGQGFTITANGIFHRCLACDAKFPQGDKGWHDLRQHQVEAHESPVTTSWDELNGLELTVAIVKREITDSHFPGTQIDVLGRAKDGTVYFLASGSVQPGFSRSGDIVWKCKPTSRESSLNRLMLPDLASP